MTITETDDLTARYGVVRAVAAVRLFRPERVGSRTTAEPPIAPHVAAPT